MRAAVKTKRSTIGSRTNPTCAAAAFACAAFLATLSHFTVKVVEPVNAINAILSQGEQSRRSFVLTGFKKIRQHPRQNANQKGSTDPEGQQTRDRADHGNDARFWTPHDVTVSKCRVCHCGEVKACHKVR